MFCRLTQLSMSKMRWLSQHQEMFEQIQQMCRLSKQISNHDKFLFQTQIWTTKIE